MLGAKKGTLASTPRALFLHSLSLGRTSDGFGSVCSKQLLPRADEAAEEEVRADVVGQLGNLTDAVAIRLAPSGCGCKITQVNQCRSEAPGLSGATKAFQVPTATTCNKHIQGPEGQQPKENCQSSTA